MTTSSDSSLNDGCLTRLDISAWTSTPLLYELDRWLKEIGANLCPGKHVAGLGINSTASAATGGGVLSVEAIQIMAKPGMELWISEYGNVSQGDRTHAHSPVPTERLQPNNRLLPIFG